MDKFTLRLFFLGVNRVKMDDLELEENQEKQAGGWGSSWLFLITQNESLLDPM